MLHRGPSFVVITVVLLAWQFWTCSGDTNLGPDKNIINAEHLIEKALALATTNPDSSLFYADSALYICAYSTLPDSVHLRALITKTDAIANSGMPDSALSVLQKYYFDHKEWSDSSLLLKTLYCLCRYNYLNGRLAVAGQFGEKAVKLVERNDYYIKKSPIVNLYASTHIRFGRYEEAYSWLLKSVGYAEQQKDSTSLGDAYSILGNVFLGLNNRDKARYYIQKSHNVFTGLRDTLRICVSLNDWGITYSSQNQDSALLLYNESLRMIRKYPGHFIGVVSMFNKADIYLNKAEKTPACLDTARILLDEVYRQCQENRIAEGIPKVLGAYGKIAYKTGDYAKSRQYYDEAIAASEKHGDINNTISLMTESRDVYNKSGRLDELVRLDDRIRFLQDSVRSDIQQMAILDKEWLFRMQEKELENKLLRETLEREERISQLRLILIIILTIGAALLTALIIWNRKLQRGLGMAYQALMVRYRAERKDSDSAELMSPHAVVMQRLSDYFETHKPYLNPDMRVSDIQKNLDVSAQELSAALRKNGFENFNAFLNQTRVREVQRRFENPEFDHYSVEAIAKDAGFGSRTSFYRAFETVTGVRPAYYRSQIRRNTDQ